MSDLFLVCAKMVCFVLFAKIRTVFGKSGSVSCDYGNVLMYLCVVIWDHVGYRLFLHKCGLPSNRPINQFMSPHLHRYTKCSVLGDLCWPDERRSGYKGRKSDDENKSKHVHKVPRYSLPGDVQGSRSVHLSPFLTSSAQRQIRNA